MRRPSAAAEAAMKRLKRVKSDPAPANPALIKALLKEYTSDLPALPPITDKESLERALPNIRQLVCLIQGIGYEL